MFPDAGPDGGFGFMFTVVPVFIGIVFVIVLGGILYSIVNGITQWSHNNKQPVLVVQADAVAKRTEVSHSTHHHDNHAHSTSSTRYFVTFEVESGDRMEFQVDGPEYGQIVEGDRGRLTFQGTRYKGFQRGGSFA